MRSPCALLGLLVLASACTRPNPLYAPRGDEDGSPGQDSSTQADAAGTEGGACVPETPAAASCPLAGTRWTFEDGLQGWHPGEETTLVGNLTDLTVSCERAYCGLRSATYQVKLGRTVAPTPTAPSQEAGSYAGIQNALSTSDSISAATTLQAEVFVEDTLGQTLLAWFIVGMPSATGATPLRVPAGPSHLQNGWNDVRIVAPMGVTTSANDLRLIVELGNTGNWEGRIFVDTIGWK